MAKITGVGLGTYSFSNVFTHVTKNEIKKIVKTFLDQGGKYIETAPLYQVNELMREVLAEIPRDAYYLSVKCVTGVNEKGEKIRSGKYYSILEQCDLELKTLGVDYIDLYMMHIPPPDASPKETMSALVLLQKKGRIREIGISNVNLSQLKEFNSFGSVRYIQNRFSLLNRSMSDEMVQYCVEHKIDNLPYQVIERGLLTNKGASSFELRDGDVRRSKSEFNESVRSVIRQWVVNYLKPIADELNISVEVMAIWWALQQPTVAICLVGATSRTQIINNMKAHNLSLPSGSLYHIESAYQALVHQLAPRTVRQFMGLE